jgi:uncharacterized protein
VSTRVLERIAVSRDALAEVCERYDVQELALFGSVLRDDFREDSDIDVLVMFKPGARMGLFRFIDLQRELEKLLGRSVDLVPKDGLKRLVRKQVLESSEVIYAA